MPDQEDAKMDKLIELGGVTVTTDSVYTQSTHIRADQIVGAGVAEENRWGCLLSLVGLIWCFISIVDFVALVLIIMRKIEPIEEIVALTDHPIIFLVLFVVSIFMILRGWSWATSTLYVVTKGGPIPLAEKFMGGDDLRPIAEAINEIGRGEKELGQIPNSQR